MQKTIFMLAALCLAASAFAQTDTTNSSSNKSQPDTIFVGKFVIIKRGHSSTGSGSSNSSGSSVHINIDSSAHRKQSAVSTNWLIFDLGFANYTDRTNYADANQSSYLNANGGAPFSKDDFHLKTIKSSNVNIWFFMQKLNVTKHVLNLKYGLGLEMFNFRYDNNISYNAKPTYIYRDSVDFSKDKLYAGYLTVPLMFNIDVAPKRRHSFTFSGGVSAGYLVGSHTKQISSEHGKQKLHDDFELNPWRFAYVAELGIGPVRLYGSYSINPLHSDALKQYPYTVGIRFSNW